VASINAVSPVNTILYTATQDNPRLFLNMRKR
jgi:hypothetical protein